MKGFFYVTKKIFENIVLFLNYNDFVANYNNKENYLIAYYDEKQLKEYRSINYDDFILNPKVVLLSNHGYNKDLNLLFVFDALVSSGIEISYSDDRQKYFFDSFQPTFIFYGLLFNKKLELLSIIYIIIH